MYVVLIPFPWKRFHTFMGGSVSLEGYRYYSIHCVKGKRPRYGRDKANKKATRDEGSKFSVEFGRAFSSSTKTIAYFDIRS